MFTANDLRKQGPQITQGYLDNLEERLIKESKKAAKYGKKHVAITLQRKYQGSHQEILSKIKKRLGNRGFTLERATGTFGHPLLIMRW